MAKLETRRCPACGGTANRTAGVARGFPMQSCAGCRTLFTARFPGEHEAKDYENWGYYEGGLEVPDFVLERLKETVSSLDGYRRLNTWLDVGCGAGTLLRAATAKGYDAVGTEVAPAAANAVRAAGFDVRVGELRDLDMPEGGFDVVSMVEVLEHVPEPAALLADAARLVRPGGALYLTTPHAGGISGRLLGTRWSVVSPPEHLQLFSAAGIATALRGAGLVLRSLRTHAVNPYEFVAAVRRARGQEDRCEGHTQTSYRLNESLSSSAVRANVKAMINAGLSATRLGDSIKAVAERPR